MFPWISTTCFNSKLTEEIFVIIALYTIVSVQGDMWNFTPGWKSERVKPSVRSLTPISNLSLKKLQVPATNWAVCQQLQRYSCLLNHCQSDMFPKLKFQQRIVQRFNNSSWEGVTWRRSHLPINQILLANSYLSFLVKQLLIWQFSQSKVYCISANRGMNQKILNPALKGFDEANDKAIYIGKALVIFSI